MTNTREWAELKAAIEEVSKGQDRLHAGQQRIHERIDHLDECVDDMKLDIKGFRGDVIRELDSIRTTLTAAFPGGDVHAHRQDHIQQKVSREKWDDLFHSVKKKIIGALSLSGVLLVLGLLAEKYLK